MKSIGTMAIDFHMGFRARFFHRETLIVSALAKLAASVRSSKGVSRVVYPSPLIYLLGARSRIFYQGNKISPGFIEIDSSV